MLFLSFKNGDMSISRLDKIPRIILKLINNQLFIFLFIFFILFKFCQATKTTHTVGALRSELNIVQKL